MSLTELDYAIPNGHGEIRNQLDRLVEAGILDRYSNESSEPTQDLPMEFYGPTERGVEILYEFKHLRGVPIVRALYQNTEKSPEVLRHENAPRPELPRAVQEALSIDGDCEATE